MKHEQFDNLTRAFAVGISRLQALKLVLGVLLLGSCGSSSSPGSTTPKPTASVPKACPNSRPVTEAAIIPLPANNLTDTTKTCDGISTWREKIGVAEGNGDPHPGYAGWTLNIPTYSPYTYDKNPPTQSGGQICLQTTAIQVHFDVATMTYSLDWQPPAGSSSSCQKAIDAWKHRIALHEGKHVADAQDIMDAANRKWQTANTYKACATTEAQADQQLQQQITADLDAEIANINKMLQDCANRFHQTPEGSLIVDPDCSSCNPHWNGTITVTRTGQFSRTTDLSNGYTDTLQENLSLVRNIQVVQSTTETSKGQINESIQYNWTSHDVLTGMSDCGQETTVTDLTDSTLWYSIAGDVYVVVNIQDDGTYTIYIIENAYASSAPIQGKVTTTYTGAPGCDPSQGSNTWTDTNNKTAVNSNLTATGKTNPNPNHLTDSQTIQNPNDPDVGGPQGGPGGPSKTTITWDLTFYP